MNRFRLYLCRVALFFVAVLVFAGLVVSADEKRSDALPPVETITAEELLAHISYLASDELEGRDTPSPGLEKAADYIAAEFKKYGLEPVCPEDLYFQHFYVSGGYTLGPNNRLELFGKDGRKVYSMPKSFVPFNFSRSGQAGFGSNGEDTGVAVVFAGYGISDEALGYDDYAGVDVRGKVVLVLSHEPQEYNPFSKFNGIKPTKWSDPYEKARNAERHGAVGLLLVTGPNTRLDLRPRGSNWPQFQSKTDRLIEWVVDFVKLLMDKDEPEEAMKERPPLSIPVLHVSQGVARDLLAPMGKELSRLQRRIDRRCKPYSFVIEGSTIGLAVDVKRDEGMRVKNVAAVLRGADPQLAQEYVIICAHYDHIGVAPVAEGGGNASSGPSHESTKAALSPTREEKEGVAPVEEEDRIYNGADDNASGTAGVLEIAQAFASAAERPARSIMFIAWAGEERGLLGSRYFIRNPLVPLKSIKAVVNLDMIGRSEEKEVFAIGPLFDDTLCRMSKKFAGRLGLNLRYIPLPRILAPLGASDHTPFLMRGIPSLHLFAGMHEDYHKVSDETEKINAGKTEAISRLAYLIVEALGKGRERATLK